MILSLAVSFQIATLATTYGEEHGLSNIAQLASISASFSVVSESKGDLNSKISQFSTNSTLTQPSSQGEGRALGKRLTLKSTKLFK